MEHSAENVTENSLPVTKEPSVNLPDSVVTEKSVDMNNQIVTSAAADGAQSDVTQPAAKAGDETRCKTVDDVKYEWTDITSEFIGACSSLELGELVHDSKY